MIIYSIRTRLFFLKAGLPSWPLIGFGLIAALLSIFIPFTKLGQIFHFVQPSFQYIMLVIGLVCAYFIMTL